MARWWWKRGKEEEVSEELDGPNDSFSPVAPLPDLERLAGEDLVLPKPAEDNDVCFCGQVELVYGGSVQIDTDEPSHDGLRKIELHRKDDPCEILGIKPGATDGSHVYLSNLARNPACEVRSDGWGSGTNASIPVNNRFRDAASQDRLGWRHAPLEEPRPGEAIEIPADVDPSQLQYLDAVQVNDRSWVWDGR